MMFSFLLSLEEEARVAAEASMAVVEAAGCRSAADFLLTFNSCSNSKASSQSSHVDVEAAPPSPFPFQLIILTKCSMLPNYFGRPSSVREDAEFGVNALLFLVERMDDLERTLLALASIPPFTSLVIDGIDFLDYNNNNKLRDALFQAIRSANFWDLQFIYVFLPEEWGAGLRVCTNSLRSLYLVGATMYSYVIFENLVLASLSTSLTKLHLDCSLITSTQIQKLFAALEESPHLTELFLYCSRNVRSKPWPRNAILDSLRRNDLLHKVNLVHTPLRGDSAIAAQLEKNRENAARLKALGMERVKPSTIRLHFCGLPLSGKTTISRSLAKCSKGSSFRWLSADTIKVSDRTRGIEVTTLENRQEQQRISIWDMAGQIEYHSFHDSMLPDLIGRAAPPLFLYVWNPFEMDARNKVARDKGGRIIGFKSPDQFQADFKYWLRLIASKTLKSERFKPKVLVAITRADFGLQDIEQFLGPSFDAIHEEFKDYIQFDKEGFFKVDATNVNKIYELRSHLFKCAQKILSEAPDESKVCDEARKVFANLNNEKKIPPLLSKDKFARLCLKHLGIESLETCEAVALSLSNSGDLIYFSSLKLVVVNTLWFCQKIMGDLLHFNTKSRTLAHSKGFFPIQSLQDLLEKEINLSKRKISWTRSLRKVLACSASTRKEEALKVSGDDLVNLLLGMRLACREYYDLVNSRIFVPASLCGMLRDRIIPRMYFKDDKSLKCYIGRRWAVKDAQCTLLTPGVFPLLQVTFHNILSNQKIETKLDQDVMAFVSSGFSVFVEFCRLEGIDNFIDVLVGSKQSVNEVLEWLHENVTVRMKEVFANSRGIPGVELVESVIQPACVQELKEARERSAVSVEHLQRSMREHLEKKGATDALKNVQYSWQGELFTNDPVIDLLGEVEVGKLVEAYRASLSEAAKVVLDLSGGADVEEITPQRGQRPQFGTSPSHIQRAAIYDKVCDVEDNMNRGFEQLARQVEGVRGDVLPKLHQMLTFVQEGEAGKLPRMFVVTQNVGTGRRVVARVVPGLRNSQLELLCESRKAVHLVDGQKGLCITTLDDGLLKRGLPYINGFLKLANVVTKIGAHVALGFGETIPDFTRLLAGVIDAKEFEPVSTFCSTMTDFYNSSSRVDFGKGQQWLFDVLSHHDCTKGDQIYTQFGLHRIRCSDSRVAWVCKEHYSEGQPFPA